MEEKELSNVIYIARDEGSFADEDCEIPIKGKLHLFYDTPELRRNDRTNLVEYTNARIICELPSYMYPELENCRMREIKF